MKLKLSHISVIIGGVIVVFLLNLLPQKVVSDKEKKIKETENKVKEEVNQNLAQHGEDKVDKQLIAKLQNKINTETSLEVKSILVDSLAHLYRDAFVLDSSLSVYLRYAPQFQENYLKAVRDGLTGLRMSPSKEKQQYYAQLCKDVVNKGLESDSLDLELKVEALRLKVFTATINGQPPMQGIFELKELVAANPDLLSGYIALAEFYTTVGKSDQAIQQYLQVLDYDKDNLQAHVELVSLYLGTNKSERAREFLTRLQEINSAVKDSFIEDFINKSLKKLN